MWVSKRTTTVGAAACALGISLLGHPIGLAAADDGGDGAAAQLGGMAGPAQPSPSRSARNARGATTTPAGARRSAPSANRRAAAQSPETGSRGMEFPSAAAAVRPRAVNAGTRGPVLTAPASSAAQAPTAAVAAAAPSTAAVATPTAASATAHSTGAAPCLACWGMTAPTIGQGIATAINHVFNSAFDLLSTFPAGPISNVIEGGLLLIRRTLFGGIGTGVTATQSGDSLTVSVNTGSVAYFQTNGTTLEVSGDPGFKNAQQFTASSVSQVVTDANGKANAGCAGFVLTGGTVIGDLVTNGIDDLRFESGSEFTGKVKADAVPGSLTVGQAVRGLQGVVLGGPVILTGDTVIDAGSGDAIFGGTVDGSGWFGGQSLLVTALGATTFAGDVGSRRALGNLTTQAITPLQVAQSADSKTIPLSFNPLLNSNGVEVKYGIDVAIGDNPARTYLFDTGGNGFFAGYDPAYFNGVTPTTGAVDITYTSEQTLHGLATPAVVTIGSGANTVSTVRPVDLATVISATNGSGAPIPVTAPFGGPFAGDFGGAFGVQPVTGKTLYEPGSYITSPLFQLPGNLSSGYLVQLGPIGTAPQLTVGVTDALRAQFPYAVPVSILADSSGTSVGDYPGTSNPLLQQFGFSPQYIVSEPFQAYGLGEGPLPSLIDSGAGSTSARLPDLPKPFEDANGNLTPGATFLGIFPTALGKPQLVWQYTAGNIGSVDQVGYMNSTGAAIDVPNVNTGLNLFNGFDVMYDVQGVNNQAVIWLRPNGGLATVNLQSVTTKGAQSYGQNAVLDGTYTTGGKDFSVAGTTTVNGNSVVDAGRGNATFSGTVDAAKAGVQGLQVNSRGAITFVRPVGSDAPLASLTTGGGGSTTSMEVTTTGAQTYGGDVTLIGTYVSDHGDFTVDGATTIAGPTSVQTANASVTFGGAVDSAAGEGHVLGIAAPGSTVKFMGKVGATNPLGGLNLRSANSFNSNDTVTLSGILPNSQGIGLFVADGVTVNFSYGGLISQFTTSGVVFEGDSQSSVVQGFEISGNVYDGIQFVGQNYGGTVIRGNTIIGNSAFGIETLQAADGLAIRGNIIGSAGTSNQWGYTSGGPNAQGIVLAPGDYTGTVIADNTIQYNRRNGISAPDGVQGVVISGNTVQYNEGNGINFTGGDFSGTIVTGNSILNNAGDGISLGAGIGQALNDFGNPLNGYRDRNPNNPADTNPYELGHYFLPFSNDPGFYDQAIPSDPQVRLTLNEETTLTVNLDTGSRGLYFDQEQVPKLDTSGGTPGFVYLNSSNRLYFGTWVDTDITFPDSGWSDPNVKKVATAKAPVLVVSAIGASTTPPPGSTTPSATFATTTSQGTVKITNGTQTESVSITANGKVGYVTIPGGWWASYSDNPGLLGPVANFGVGFDRTGLGTEPVTNGANQAYNTFLNLKEMQDGTMRPGYVISADGVTLGLDSTVTNTTPFAYTDLAPSGLSQGGQTAPDWQPATGRVTYKPTSGPDYPSELAPLVIDIGIPTGILTLPGYPSSTQFTGQLRTDLLNSGGAVAYTVEPSDASNLMTATSVAFFSPLAGAYSQNMPPVSQQFFNTGRRVIAGMDYLYDAAGGYEGLYTPNDPTENPQQAEAFDSAGGTFTAAYYPNLKIPGGVTNLSIQNNIISGNGGNGVTVNGQTSIGDVMSGNLVYGNTGLGIALTNGGNGGQPAPVVESATMQGISTVNITGSVAGIDGYSGPFQVQFYTNPQSDSGNVQGRQLLGTINTTSNDFAAEFTSSTTNPGWFITVVATPAGGAPNTSEFSAPFAVQ